MMAITTVVNLDALERQYHDDPTQLMTLDLRLHLVNRDEAALSEFMTQMSYCEGMRKVKTLNLSDNGLTSLALIKHLSSAWYIETLDALYLDGNCFESQHMEILSSCTQMTQLRVLDFNGNWFGDDAMTFLGQASFFSQLTSLNLGVNWITERGVQALFEHASSLAMEHLIFGPNMSAIGDAGAIVLANTPSLKHLTTLNLQNNGIGKVGYDAITTSPYVHLESLDVSNVENVFYTDCESYARNVVFE